MIVKEGLMVFSASNYIYIPTGSKKGPKIIFVTVSVPHNSTLLYSNYSIYILKHERKGKSVEGTVV